MLVLIKSLSGHNAVAYVPQGPEFAPEEEKHGLFLEALSASIVEGLNSRLAFIRYDLPWKSPYAEDMAEKGWWDYPEPRIQEMRMNFGTRHCNLRKAPVNMMVTHSAIVDIGGSPEQIFARMKPKTRYNIRLAARKGVCVRSASVRQLPAFYALHRETARRNKFLACELDHLMALFAARGGESPAPEVALLMATHGRDVLAGAIIAISRKGAVFLHGASANVKRDHMGPYALHWAAIQYARSCQCRTYDMGAVSPGRDPAHRFFGLYRFKSGFGGRIVHRSGTWDFPLDEEAYTDFRNSETLQSG